MLTLLKVLAAIAALITVVLYVIASRYEKKYKELLARAKKGKSVKKAEEAVAKLKRSERCKSIYTINHNVGRAAIFFGIVTVALIVGLVAYAINQNIDKSKTASDDNKSTTTEEAYADDGEEDTGIEDIPSSVIFCNDQLQNDNNKDNDFNLAPPLSTSSAEAALSDLLANAEHDPVSLGNLCLGLDIKLGTNYVGASEKQYRMLYTNDLIAALTYDPDYHKRTYKAVKKLIDEQCVPSLHKGKCKDQTFVLPASYTSGGKIPQLILKKTKQKNETYLQLDFKHVKNNKFALKFRCKCGGQLTNAQKYVEPTTSSGGSSYSGGNNSGGHSSGGNNSGSHPGTGGDNGDGCKDNQTWTTSQGQNAERRTDTPTGGGNSHDNASDPPSGGASRIDQGSGGGQRTADPPQSAPAVDSGNGKVSGDDD